MHETTRTYKHQYEVVSVYGPNMVATEGPVWKRHRAVAKPAFNEVGSLLTLKKRC
jgi:cytochrome P450